MNSMNINFASPAVIIGAVVLVLLIAVGIAVAVGLQKKKTAQLRSRFGAEYDLLLQDTGSRKKTEEALSARVKRVEVLKIRDLTGVERNRYLSEWELVQSRFIDHPRGAVTEADELMNSLLMACGYPAGGYDQRMADLSVHHSSLVGPYRLATVVNSRAGRNEATTEELRGALIQYRTLFDALLGTKTALEPEYGKRLQPAGLADRREIA
jgi:hypothetical protein